MDGEFCGQMTSLFHQMERQRAKIPGALRENYVPVFVVKRLQEALCTGDEDTSSLGSKRGGSELLQKKLFEITSEDDIWSDNSLLEANADFEGTFLIPDAQLEGVDNILKFCENAIECSLLEKSKLLFQFVDEFEHPCLELLYFMDIEYKVMSLATYILRLQGLPQSKYFKKQFLALCFSQVAFSSSESRERSTKILEQLLQRFIIMHYCNPSSKPSLVSAKKMAGEVLETITMKLVSDEDETKLSYFTHATLLVMIKEVNIPDTVRRRYFQEQLSSIVLKNGNSTHPKEIEIIQFQETYADPTKLVSMENFSATVSEMLRSVLPDEDIAALISSNIGSKNFNWESMLFIITIWIQERQKKATTLLTELVKAKLREGLSEKNETLIISSFIIARHCCLIASDLFSRYVSWYMNMFENESYSPANDFETFMFLTTVLTKWVPVEPSIFLHSHTTYRPFIPNGCREAWGEYVSLAKTRIAEYKEVEEAMELEPNPNDPVQHEVEMAVRAFQANKKIPQSVHKMWVLQKNHYFKEFLPALLRKPQGVAVTDARLRLIEMLRKDNKISPDLYNTYKTSTMS